MELEQELISHHPRNDDIKDALANAVAISIPPKGMVTEKKDNVVKFHSRWGGVAA